MSNNQYVQQSINPTINKSNNQYVQQSINPTINMSNNQYVQQSIYPTINKSNNQYVQQSINHIIKTIKPQNQYNPHNSPQISLPSITTLKRYL